MAETEVRVVLADAVVVGPEDNLIIHIGDMSWTAEVMDDLMAHFKAVGLEDRVLVIQAEQIAFAKVAKE